jgi:hypothetical protein
MGFLSVSAGCQQLFGAAISYSYLNYSVIPVFGNTQIDRAKVAAVDWKPFQSRKATEKDFDEWFKQQGFGGLAIVTGNISRLIVLDFDEQWLADEFARRFPSLTQTRVIESAGRGLPHYYYHIPLDVTVPSRRVKGADLLANGRYVVAPPTKIGASAYKIVRGGQPRTLTIAQIRLIEAFLAEQSSTTYEETKTPENQPVAVKWENTPATPIALLDAIALYKYHAVNIGRNEALFKVSLKMRDTGWLVDDVLSCLVYVHVHQAATHDHAPETSKQRYAEAVATIMSAFSRPPQKPKDSEKPSPGLPTALREHLLKQKMGYLVRVLDGLLMNNVTQGSSITEKNIVNLVHGDIGRHSVLKALTATYEDGTSIFVLVDPSPKPLTHTNVASAIAVDTNNKCLLFRAAESDENPRGRPPKSYRMPDIATLCARFGVQFSSSDPVTKADLQSTKTYRQAMQREFIKRRPGLYSMNWLADRLGVTKRTLQRYRPNIPIQQKATFQRTNITWDSLNLVPDDVEVFGAFLEDTSGKKYPPKRDIAMWLLKCKKNVLYVRQAVNYYWHPDTPPSPLAVLGVHPKSPIIPLKACLGDVSIPLSLVAQVSSTLPAAAEVEPVLNSVSESIDTYINVQKMNPAVEVSPQQISAENYKVKSKRYYHEPLSDETIELAAKRLYDRTRAMTQGKKEGYLSMATARHLAEQYGASEVKRLLQLFTWRDNIENPAAFAVVWFRSESKRERLHTLFR